MVKLTALTQEVLAAILKSIDEGIHVVNTNGETIFYNEVAAKHDGMAVEEVLGQPLLAVFPSLTGETSTLLKVLKTEKPIYNQAQIYVNVHGKRIDTINTTLPIFLENNIIGAVEIAKDYSRMKLLAESLLDLQKSVSSKKEKKAINRVTYTLADIKTANLSFERIINEAKKFAKSDSPIIVYGESGTGKELFVQGIHYESMRANGPFIAQNCAAIPETLLESILFGTSKGSYTGATERRGLFELADEGTLFLDELHAMPNELQAKLLRVLEDGLVRHVGGTDLIHVNVRVIAAMNEHPSNALENQRLRSDLYYRLNVFTLSLIPLRERKEDIKLLTDYFISCFNEKMNKSIQGIKADLLRVFTEYPWPGNVRELKHTIEYMVNVCEGLELGQEDLPIMLKNFSESAGKKVSSYRSAMSLRENVDRLEKELIIEALNRTNGNIKQASSLLDIPRQTLQYKMKKLNIIT
jgi:arginine utilization regulatory protein